MSHEIYYTSAPEGVKRGSSGFSTVAVSDGIPKALWDRLESLSAYRHQFGPGDSGGAAGGNPVSWAHWVLSVAGTNYHVLSRICDSGVDHTQRTNAFAHHLVVERAELAAASGGPAWMLMQPGVMAEAWDGKVGAIVRGAGGGRLPGGDGSGGVCEKWKELTGDAGWGGVLAEAFVKSPQKPVCVLFGGGRGGQEVLPLLAETIALLPAAARWNVTFNTYFTSMPTSATCLWRCCLAGTPAATSGLRYAGGGAGGIVIDLTDPARLGKPAESAYVTYARTGVMPGAAPAPATQTAAAKVAAKSSKAAKVTVPPKVPPVKKTATFVDDEDSIDLAPAEMPGGAVGSGIVEALEADEQPEVEASAPEVRETPKRALIRRRITAEAPMQYVDIESEAGKAAARRRRQIVMLFGGAVALIGLAVVLVVVSMVTNAPPDLPPVIKPKTTPTTVANETPVPTPATEVALPVVHGPVIQTPAPLPDLNNTVVVPAPKPETPKQAVAPVVVLPEHPAVVTITEPVQFPVVGEGIRESVGQTLAAPGMDRRVGVEKLEIRFPASKGDYPGSMSFSEKPGGGGAGTLVASVRPTKPTTALILWKGGPAGTDAEPVELLALMLGKGNTELELSWSTAPLVKDVENVRRAYWVLRGSRIEVEWKNRTQEIAFAAGDPAPIPIDAAGAVLTIPTALPKETLVVAPTEQQLGHGWGATAFTESAVSKDGALRTSENDAQVLKFQQKSAVPASAPWFVVRFSPGLDRVENTFGARFAAAQADLKSAQDDLKTDTDVLAQMKEAAGGKLPDSDQVKLVKTKQADAATLVEAYKSTVDGYNALEQLDIELTLPNGVHLTTVRFRRMAK